MRTVEDLMALNYKLIVVKEKDFDGTEYFVASHVELGGIEGTGDTEEEAIEDLNAAKAMWFDNMIRDDLHIPLPKNYQR